MLGHFGSASGGCLHARSLLLAGLSTLVWVVVIRTAQDRPQYERISIEATAMPYFGCDTVWTDQAFPN